MGSRLKQTLSPASYNPFSRFFSRTSTAFVAQTKSRSGISPRIFHSLSLPQFCVLHHYSQKRLLRRRLDAVANISSTDLLTDMGLRGCRRTLRDAGEGTQVVWKTELNDAAYEDDARNDGKMETELSAAH